MSNKNNLPITFTVEQVDRILQWFGDHSFIIVDTNLIGEVELPEVNPEYIKECLEEGN